MRKFIVFPKILTFYLVIVIIGELQLKCMQQLAGYSWSCKGKYGFLMEYIQVFGMAETLEHLNCGSSISTVLSHVIENIHNQKLANYVSNVCVLLIVLSCYVQYRQSVKILHYIYVEILASENVYQVN